MASSSNYNDMAQYPGMTNTSSTSTHMQPTEALKHPPGRQNANVTVYQTTGPDAYTIPLQVPGSSAPALNPRSCVTCRRRKVRCDKQMPCSNCRRALIPCVFPAPGRAPRQPRPKDPNAPSKHSSQREVELVKRLRKLEGIVEELSGQIEVESGGRGPSSAGSPDATNQATAAWRHNSFAQGHTGAGSSTSPKDVDSSSDLGSEGRRNREINAQLGRLVLNDHKGSTRYVTSGFWSKLNDELDALREETEKLTDDASEESDYEETPPHYSPGGQDAMLQDHHAFILGYRSADVDLRSCHPLPSHVPFLWSVYVENVEPLIKILHVPSMDAQMREARRGPEKLAPGMEALVFAIYYSAVVSLEPEEVQANFGANKENLLRQYRFALEQSLSKANFLNTTELCVLQAFTIFLVVVRRFDDSRFCWSLTGLVIRLAQGMGLHRDGTKFDMTPYETEMRRRLWWAILILDLRSAEELGMDLTAAEGSFDTHMPLNINDADISPETAEPPMPHEGRTDAAMALVRIEVLNLSRQLHATNSAAKGPETSPIERENVLVNNYRRIQHKFFKHAMDEADPLWWVAAMISRIIMSKMCLLIYQPSMFPGADAGLTDDIRQRIFVSSIEIIELGQRLNTDPRCRQWRWLFMTYTNWHAIAFNLMETCRRPWTALVERSWEAVSRFDKDPAELAKKADQAAVFLPLRKLFVRARKHRELQLNRFRNNVEEARRLDYQERMNPAEARFGPVPGNEHRMEQFREKWWSMILPEGAGAAASSWNPQPRASAAPSLTMSKQSPASQPTPEVYKPEPARQMDISEAAMEYMDDIMSQPNMVMADMWPLNRMLSPEQKQRLGMAIDVPAYSQASDDHALRQQALALQAQTAHTDGLMEPYMWQGQYTAPQQPKAMGMNDPLLGDNNMDMLEGDFDWQDWSHSLQNLDVMQPR